MKNGTRNTSQRTHLPSTLNSKLNSAYFRITAAVLAALVVVLLCVDRPAKSERHIRERVSAGKTAPLHSYVEVYSYRGLWINLGLAALLVAATPWAARKLSGDASAAVDSAKPMAKWEWIALGGIVLFSAVQNYPRLGHSLWGDEEYTMKRLIADEVKRGEDGKLEFEPVSWMTTFWSFRKPTNHIGYTVMAHACHDLFFRPGNGPTDPFFSERLMRLPVYVAGLLSIGALVWACRVWGFAAGAVPAAFAYAMHPWFTRFGVDARGYGFVLLLIPLLFGLLGRGMQTGRWRWWLLLAAAQFYLFWTYFGSVYWIIGIHAAAVGLIWLGGERPKPDRLIVTVRWLVSGVASAMLVVAMMAPCWPQLFEFLASKPLHGEMDRAWWHDAAAYLLSGMPWHPWDAANPLCVSWSQDGGSVWIKLGFISLLLMVIAVVMGWFVVLKQKAARWLLIPLLGSPLLMVAHQSLSGIRPYHWYLIPALPGMLLAVAAAICFLPYRSSPSANPAVRPFFVVSIPFLAAVMSPLGSVDQRSHLIHHPIEPCRESVALTRKVTNPRHPDYDKEVITGAFSFYTEGYDPGQLRFENAEGLKALMQRADAEERQLFVNFGFKAWAVQHFPDIVAVLDDPLHFEHVATLPGQFLASTREVYRYKNNTLSTKPGS